MTTTHVGYGPFRLSDLKAGEEFVLSDASYCKVDRSPHRSGERIRVWLDHATQNSRPTFLHPSARVYATSPEQARCIARRLSRRRAKKKGQQHDAQ